MIRKILGAIGVFWGGLIFLNLVLSGFTANNESYIAGQIASLALAVLMFGFGVRALRK